MGNVQGSVLLEGVHFRAGWLEKTLCSVTSVLCRHGRYRSAVAADYAPFCIPSPILTLPVCSNLESSGRSLDEFARQRPAAGSP